MKNLILGCIATFLLASCNDFAHKKSGLVMIGNKPFKLVVCQLDGSYFKVLVPADSSVSIIPDNTTYTNGKSTETTILIK